MRSQDVPRKLFLLDGMALVYRSYFAFANNPRVTSYGFNTSAIFGFANTVLDILKGEKPSHLAVVFDTAAPTERHIVYEQYKAQREAMPEDIGRALPYVERFLHAMNIPMISMDGYEADDIIGTLAKEAGDDGYTVYMMTPDKDFGQLVGGNVYIYKPGRLGNEAEILGVPEVLARWEISRVDQVIDILGLMGDAVDNIPGIPGVGEKTAIKFIAQYGSVENLLAHTHELKGKMKEKVEANTELAILSKQLATINIQVPVVLNDFNLTVDPPDRQAVEELCQELEFRTLPKRIFSEAASANAKPVSTNLFGEPIGQKAKPVESFVQDPLENAPAVVIKTLRDVPHTYHVADTEEKIMALIAELKKGGFCFDTETTSLVELDAELVGMSFSVQSGEAWYVPFPENRSEAQLLLNAFKPLLEDEKLPKSGQNMKYDIMVLQHYGVEVKGQLFDTMIAHYLIEPDMRHGMDALALAYLNYQPISITELIGKKGAAQGNMREVPLAQIAEYAAEDADITRQLEDTFRPLLEERMLSTLFQTVEMPLMHVLADMEREGVRIDKAFLNQYSVELEASIAEVEKLIYNEAGLTFNIASPKQLGEVLFDHMGLEPKPKRTATGQYQTGEDVLSTLSNYPIVQHILDFRQWQKLKSTYVDALPTMIHPRTGRVHTSFNQTIAATGRLSSTNPNLQNIPIKTERGREVRKAFLPRDENHVLISADYSQIELRIIASLSGDENMIQAFNDGLDIHTATAARIYGVGIDEVTKDMRRNAKSVNFGIIYGQSAFGLAQQLGIPRREASEIINQYFAQYQGVQAYMEQSKVFARTHGFVETILGRRRYLRDINSRNAAVRGYAERNAINAPIQGSAADMIKVAMIDLQQALKAGKFGTKMILQVHDELLFDVPRSEVDAVSPLILRTMEAAMPLKVPVVAELGVGENWLEAH